MIDTHCHADLYPRPSHIVEQANRSGVLTIVVTNLPSAFDRALPHVQGLPNVRLALGLHPLLSERHGAERRRFEELGKMTSYIGEVGLDFSPRGARTKEAQLDSFRFVLRAIRGQQKFLTVHSRQAESQVLDALEAEEHRAVVFHWFSGSLSALKRALDRGHFFSINPAMLRSAHGRRIAASVPRERILTETDGPFVRVNGRAAIPSDVTLVHDELARLWGTDTRDVSRRVRENFLALVRPVRGPVL